jgi:beta-barrel assembly-enhancing protease
MKPSIARDLLILAGAGILLFLSGYIVVKKVDFSGPTFGYDFSVDQEEELGDLMKDGIWNQYPAVRSQKADSAIEVISRRLLNAIDSTPYRYQFRIIESDDVNAFTIPGGNIYMFSGLLTMSDSPEEVAAVLAHEIGHAEKRHVVNKIMKEFSIAVIVGILAGGDPGLIIQIIQQVVGSSFDREQEEEADRFALELLEKARIDPKHLGDFFTKLDEKGLSYSKNLEFLMTHPHNDSRIEKVRGYRTARDFQEEKIEMNWESIRDVIKEKTED